MWGKGGGVLNYAHKISAPTMNFKTRGSLHIRCILSFRTASHRSIFTIKNSSASLHQVSVGALKGFVHMGIQVPYSVLTLGQPGSLNGPILDPYSTHKTMFSALIPWREANSRGSARKKPQCPHEVPLRINFQKNGYH
jgi:hypothetical protein